MRILNTIGLVALIGVLGSAPAWCEEKKDLPPEAAELMKPLPILPTGQKVPGFPDGAPASSPDALKLSDDDIAQLKSKHLLPPAS